MSTVWDAAALRSTPALVATLELHGELGSTNNRAKELSAGETPLPALVVADQQTAGRGRGDNRWWAGDGALTFSLLIEPTNHGIDPSQHGLLSLTAAVAVIDTVRSTTGLACGYKWPNDVLLSGKKLAGILIESPRPSRLVIGVGINVENRFDDAPVEVRSRAISLADTGSTRQQVLETFLKAFSERLIQLASADARPIEAARAACVLTGSSTEIRDGDRSLRGVCRGIADDGALLLATADGSDRVVAGSVERFG